MSDKSQKKQAVELAIEQIQKQFGRGAIMRLGEAPITAVEVLPTGILPLDIALGVGGGHQRGCFRQVVCLIGNWLVDAHGVSPVSTAVIRGRNNKFVCN